MTIDVYVLGGAASRPEHGNQVPSYLTDRLDPDEYDVHYVDYLAEMVTANRTPSLIDIRASLATSVVDGATKAAALAVASPNRVAFVAYSLGCGALRRLRVDRAKGAEYTRNADGTPISIAWTAGFGDPWRPPLLESRPDDPPTTRKSFAVTRGMEPPMGDIGDDVDHYDIAYPDDGLCCCPPGSPLLNLAQWINPLTTPSQIDEATRAEIRALLDRGIQDHVWWRQPAFWLQPWNAARIRDEAEFAVWQYQRARYLIEGYLGTAHTLAYRSFPRLDAVVAAINGE